jgi:Zn-dependent protease with chaperone function
MLLVRSIRNSEYLADTAAMIFSDVGQFLPEALKYLLGKSKCDKSNRPLMTHPRLDERIKRIHTLKESLI